jgi:ElaB/YqjD/DUF883 family membrane-anchored ribosome-binding protein
MEFELKQIIAMLENLLKTNPNHADFNDLVRLKAEMEQELRELKNGVCDFCSKPCPNPECFAKEEK